MSERFVSLDGSTGTVSLQYLTPSSTRDYSRRFPLRSNFPRSSFSRSDSSRSSLTNRRRRLYQWRYIPLSAQIPGILRHGRRRVRNRDNSRPNLSRRLPPEQALIINRRRSPDNEIHSTNYIPREEPFWISYGGPSNSYLNRYVHPRSLTPVQRPTNEINSEQPIVRDFFHERSELPARGFTREPGAEGLITNGDAITIDATYSDVTNGDATNGDVTNGEVTNGDVTNGEVINGEATNGDATNGNATNGDATNGDATNGDAVNGDVTNGDPTNGDITNGDVTTGDVTTGDITNDYGVPVTAENRSRSSTPRFIAFPSSPTPPRSSNSPHLPDVRPLMPSMPGVPRPNPPPRPLTPPMPGVPPAATIRPNGTTNGAHNGGVAASRVNLARITRGERWYETPRKKITVPAFAVRPGDSFAYGNKVNDGEDVTAVLEHGGSISDVNNASSSSAVEGPLLLNELVELCWQEEDVDGTTWTKWIVVPGLEAITVLRMVD